MFALLINLSTNVHFSSCTQAHLLFKCKPNYFVIFIASMNGMHVI